MDPTSKPRKEIDEESIGEGADMHDGEGPMMATPGDDNILSAVQPRDDDSQAFGGEGTPFQALGGEGTPFQALGGEGTPFQA